MGGASGVTAIGQPQGMDEGAAGDHDSVAGEGVRHPASGQHWRGWLDFSKGLGGTYFCRLYGPCAPALYRDGEL